MLTDAQIKAAPATGTRYQLRDGKVPGLALRVGAESPPVKTWTLLYRFAGTKRRINLGRFPAVGAKRARELAADVLTAVRHGRDPEVEKVQRRATPTVADAVELYLGAITVAPRTLTTYRQRLERHVVPALGRRLLTDVTLADVRAMHAKITRAGHATDANRAVETLRAFFAWARVEWPDLVPANPARFEGFRRNAESRRERLISPEERTAILAALETGERAEPHTDGRVSPTYANAIRLALVTGMRPVDLVTLRHEGITRAVARGGRTLWVAQWAAQGEGKTKKAGQRRTLNSAAIEIVETQARITGGRGWVFPTAAGTQSSSNQLARTFRRMREVAGIPAEVKLYAARHTYVSEGVMAGIPLAVMGADVDNASAVHRYAHLARAVEDGTSETVLAVLRGAK